MWWLEPANMRQGGGGALPFLMILTAPLGTIYGSAWGYQRANPSTTIIKRGPEGVVAEFDRQFGGRSLDEQRIALAEIAPFWMAEYRRWVNPRIVIVALLSVVFLRNTSGIIVWLALGGGYAGRTVAVISRVRSALHDARGRWGDDVIDGLNLHWTLRSWKQEHLGRRGW
ncbi:MAG: hypothetical protein ACKO1M_09940 [Planctomycetota bacterium]